MLKKKILSFQYAAIFLIFFACVCAILDGGQCAEFPKKIESLLDTVQKVGGACAPPTKPCDPNSIFYTIDGSCNNLENPGAGQAQTPYARLLPALFADGFFQDRLGVNNQPLPLPRLVRTTLMPNKFIPTKYINILFEGFGQFIIHDTSRSPNEVKNIQELIPCCVKNAPADPMPDQCRPIIIPPDDPFYSKLKVTCVTGGRLRSTRNLGCDAKPILMMNYQTAHLDLSVVYASDEGRANLIRGEGGFLKIKNDAETNQQDLPTITSGAENCPVGGVTPQPGGKCFLLGDNVINQNVEVFVFEVIFMVLHNKLVAALKEINKSWDPNQLYFQARRISTAMYQQSIYKEYIPLLIGTDIAKFYQLIPNQQEGYLTGYNSKLNPQTLHEFVAGASRISHSTINGAFPFTGPEGKEEQYRLRDKFFNNEFILGKDVFLNLVKALTIQSCDFQDQFFSEEITDHLFEFPGSGFGADLISLDIKRGRESGFQGYNEYRVICGLDKLTTIDDLKDQITNNEDIQKLKILYNDVNDIDLYAGLILEKPLPGSTVGPTAACIIGAQFYVHKYGDRLYHEFESAKFSKEQLTNIKTITMSSILCLAMPEIKQVRANSLLVESPENPVIPCEQTPQLDLKLWEEK